nr:hypothetical protein [Tanacetum cinerariifolium]
MLLSKVISQGEARFLVFLSAYLQHCMRTRNSLVWRILVKNKREKDKIETKPDKNGKRGEAEKRTFSPFSLHSTTSTPLPRPSPSIPNNHQATREL